MCLINKTKKGELFLSMNLFIFYRYYSMNNRHAIFILKIFPNDNFQFISPPHFFFIFKNHPIECNWYFQWATCCLHPPLFIWIIGHCAGEQFNENVLQRIRCYANNGATTAKKAHTNPLKYSVTEMFRNERAHTNKSGKFFFLLCICVFAEVSSG